MLLPWLCISLHPGVVWNQRVQFIWQIMLISPALSCWSRVYLDKALCGKWLSSCSLQPDSWDKAPWVPGGTGMNYIPLDKRSSIMGSHAALPEPQRPGAAAAELNAHSTPCTKGCPELSTHCPLLHPSPSPGLPWHCVTCLPPAALAPGFGKMSVQISHSAWPHLKAPRCLGRNSVLLQYIILPEFLASCNLFCPFLC